MVLRGAGFGILVRATSGVSPNWTEKHQPHTLLQSDLGWCKETAPPDPVVGGTEEGPPPPAASKLQTIKVVRK